VLDLSIGDVMESPFPTVDAGQSADAVVKLLSKANPAVLVQDGKRVLGIVTRSDMLHHVMAR
jgi:predicted transcriptional regulator